MAISGHSDTTSPIRASSRACTCIRTSAVASWGVRRSNASDMASMASLGGMSSIPAKSVWGKIVVRRATASSFVISLQPSALQPSALQPSALPLMASVPAAGPSPSGSPAGSGSACAASGSGAGPAPGAFPPALSRMSEFRCMTAAMCLHTVFRYWWSGHSHDAPLPPNRTT